MKPPKSAIPKDKSNNKPYSLGMLHVMVKCLGIPREMLKLQNDLFYVHYWWVCNVQWFRHINRTENVHEWGLFHLPNHTLFYW